MDYTPVSSAGAAPNPYAHARAPLHTPPLTPASLRPYYIPPSTSPDAALPAHMSPARPLPPRPAASLSGAARDLLPDLGVDFKDSAGEAWLNTRALFDALLYKYVSVLLAQPFDVAKIVLQVSLPPAAGDALAGTATPKRRREGLRARDGRDRHVRSGSGSGSESRSRNAGYDGLSDEAEPAADPGTGADSDASDASDTDIPAYFTAAAPRSRSPRKRRRSPPSSHRSRTPTTRPLRPAPPAQHPEHHLRLKRPDSITHALGQLYATSGAVGLWRATNCTFLYSVLLRSTDTFLRSLLLAVLGLPDMPSPTPSGLAPALRLPGSTSLDLSDSPNALASLLAVALASSAAALLLAPLALIRTRLVLTPTTHPPRSLIQNLRRLPTLLAPPLLYLPTLLAHALPPLLTTATPLLLLRRTLHLTPETHPTLYPLLLSTTTLADLFLRLPLETLERRAHIAALKEHEPLLPTITTTAEWKGVAGTVYSILYQEGETRTKDARTGAVRVTRGQGAAGLVRGGWGGVWGLGGGFWGGGGGVGCCEE
ncbi:hypothetical protein LTR08_006171 [Meristemomyces frigidus]|nr:hypothetical protein LTR08_006171 [Meristemomyces frigidus]